MHSQRMNTSKQKMHKNVTKKNKLFYIKMNTCKSSKNNGQNEASPQNIQEFLQREKQSS